ncbi:hypothetical protein ABG088_02840 [Hydrogenibacillus schlegelii]|uniref:Uncharacterized protein n=1 Tax=Hydrogenibacillus schlegelii TaxID=1484 RepID=A0A179IQS3_HYDSH|nr:hypothetical protein [Hydrogenibacillus schlegelii]OAR05037.1 hypothetical protein SA87_05935 [Hydrogenibacillus schlegelii]
MTAAYRLESFFFEHIDQPGGSVEKSMQESGQIVFHQLFGQRQHPFAVRKNDRRMCLKPPRRFVETPPNRAKNLLITACIAGEAKTHKQVAVKGRMMGQDRRRSRQFSTTLAQSTSSRSMRRLIAREGRCRRFFQEKFGRQHKRQGGKRMRKSLAASGGDALSKAAHLCLKINRRLADIVQSTRHQGPKRKQR